MSDPELPTRVPCAVCLILIDAWRPAGTTMAAAPCGHTIEDITEIGRGMKPVEFGQHVPAAPKALDEVDLLYVNVSPDSTGQPHISTVLRNRCDGAVYKVPGGRLDLVTVRDILTNPVGDE